LNPAEITTSRILASPACAPKHKPTSCDRVKHFGPTGTLAISADGKTILVRSLYYPPRILAQHHGQLYGQESKLLIFGRNPGRSPGRDPGRDPKLQVESVMPLDAGPELWVSADGSVIAIESQGITVLRRSARL
jgi:hypothetical protein